MGRFRRLVALLLIIGGPAVVRGAQSPEPEQTEFSAEDEGVKHPVAIPSQVIEILKADRRVLNFMKNSAPPIDQPPASWFSASQIHLTKSDEVDLVILAEGELRGANVIEFWVFRPASGGYQLLLSAPAHDLIVKKVRWKGYREIEISGATAVEWSKVTLRFDGSKYVQYKVRSGQNGQ